MFVQAVHLKYFAAFKISLLDFDALNICSKTVLGQCPNSVCILLIATRAFLGSFNHSHRRCFSSVGIPGTGRRSKRSSSSCTSLSRSSGECEVSPRDSSGVSVTSPGSSMTSFSRDVSSMFSAGKACRYSWSLRLLYAICTSVS